MKTCSVKDCVQSVYAKGYCSKHYARQWKHGDTETLLKRGRKPIYAGISCKIDNCDRQAKTKGYCSKHYANWLRTGNPIAQNPHERGHVGCLVEDCDKKHFAKGYCQKHYLRFKKSGDPHYKSSNAKKIDRNRACLLMYEAGYTLASIGKILRITRERVRQIVVRERRRQP